jgi:hypothetical protein
MRILYHAYKHTDTLFLMDNPVIIELESRQILPQVSTYHICNEALKRIKKMPYVKSNLIEDLEDVVDRLRVCSHEYPVKVRTN